MRRVVRTWLDAEYLASFGWRVAGGWRIAGRWGILMTRRTQA